MNELHTQGLEKTEFMDPMTDEAILKYAHSVVNEMDEEKVISGQGMDFITRTDNIPCEEDQESIMTLIEEIYNGQKESTEANGTDAGAKESSPSSEGTEPASDEETPSEAVAEASEPQTDAVAEVQDTPTSEVGESAQLVWMVAPVLRDSLLGQQTPTKKPPWIAPWGLLFVQRLRNGGVAYLIRLLRSEKNLSCGV